MTDEKMNEIMNELRENTNDWTSVTGDWEGYATVCCAIVYPESHLVDGYRVEYAWCGENMASVLRAYAEANGYFFIDHTEVA